MTEWTTKQSKQFDPGGLQINYYLYVETNILFRILFARLFCVCLFFCLFCLVFSISKQVREVREFSLKDGSDWDANQMRELLLHDRSAYRYFDLH